MAVKPATAHAHRTAHRHWQRCSELLGAPLALTTPDSAAWMPFFAAQLTSEGYRPGTVANYGSGAIAANRAATGVDIAAPKGTKTLLSDALAGFDIIDERGGPVRRPLTILELWSLVDAAVARGTFTGDNIACALLLGFHGGLRIGELCWTIHGRPAQRQHVSFLERPVGRTTLVVDLHWFKNMIHGKPPVPVVIGDIPPGSVCARVWRCPVRTLQHVWRTHGSDFPPDSLILQTPRGPLRDAHVNAFLHQQARLRGWEDGSSLSHSVFRFSCTTALEVAGTDRDIVRAHLRWRSKGTDVSLDWYSRARVSRLEHLTTVLAASAAQPTSSSSAVRLATGFQR